jgi:hypothetical protein
MIRIKAAMGRSESEDNARIEFSEPVYRKVSLLVNFDVRQVLHVTSEN